MGNDKIWPHPLLVWPLAGAKGKTLDRHICATGTISTRGFHHIVPLMGAYKLSHTQNSLFLSEIFFPTLKSRVTCLIDNFNLTLILTLTLNLNLTVTVLTMLTVTVTAER